MSFSRAVRTEIALKSEAFRNQVLGNLCNHAYFLFRVDSDQNTTSAVEALAADVIQNPTSYLDRFALAVIHDTRFDATDNEAAITDNDVDGALATVWEWFA